MCVNHIALSFSDIEFQHSLILLVLTVWSFTQIYLLISGTISFISYMPLKALYSGDLYFL